MVTCCVANCGNNGSFSFPKTENLKNAWVKAINYTRPVTSKLKVCGRHFEVEDLDVIVTSKGD